MPKKRDRRLLAKISLPPLDQDLFKELLDILKLTFNGNYSAIARMLDITRQTLVNWEKNPPKGKWWNHILLEAIKETRLLLSQSGKKKYRKAAAKIPHRLGLLGINELNSSMEFETIHQSGSVPHLLRVLLHFGGTVRLDTLKKERWSGGYSMRTLRNAAETLQLKRTVEGFGADKEGIWSIPTEDDDEQTN